jgi:hypothetical protein
MNADENHVDRHRFSVIRKSQEEEDRKQDSGSESEMIALGYSENTTSRHDILLVRISIIKKGVYTKKGDRTSPALPPGMFLTGIATRIWAVLAQPRVHRCFSAPWVLFQQ